MPGIILIHWDNLKDTIECLDTLAQSDAQGATRLIVNAKVKSHAQKLSQHQSKPIVINATDKIRGFAENNNLGIHYALKHGITRLVLLNNDTTVPKVWLKPLLSKLNDSSVAFVSPKIYFYPGNEYYQYPKKYQGKVVWYAGGVIDWQNMLTFHRGVDEVDRGQFEQGQEVDFSTGCCLAFTKETLKKVGYLDKSYFMYLEDVDWSYRANKLGLKNYFQPKSFIWHKNAGATKGVGSKLQQYYQTRNRLNFGLQYAPLSTKAALVKEALLTYSSSPAIRKQAIKDALMHRMKYPDQLKKLL